MTLLRPRNVWLTVKLTSLCIAVVAAAALAAAVEPARACSCVPPDPWSYLERADGAFVGRLVSRREADQGQAVLLFSVEQAVKGKIGTTVEVTTPSRGAACGIETSVGQRVGLFLDREGSRWFGHLCWQVEPEDLLAAAALPAPNGRGAVALLVGGSFGPARTLALDAKGRTLAYGFGAGHVHAFSVCPGGRRVAEFFDDTPSYGADTVAIRELPTLRLIRRQRLNRYYGEGDPLQCTKPNGEQIVGFYGSGPGLERPARLVRITPKGTVTLWRGRAWYASFKGNFGYVQVNPAFRTTVVAVDLRNGTAKNLGTVPVGGAYELVPNPDGTRLAGDSYEEGSGDPRLVVIDLEARPISARTIPLPTECCGSTRWLRDEQFAYFSGSKILVYGAELQQIARVSGWNAGYPALVGLTAYGLRLNGALVAAKLPSGVVRVVRRLPGEPSVIASASH